MDTPERTVGGRYQLLAPLGSGGMGTVWRAHDLVLDREVAVKEVSPPRGVSPDETEVLRERTRREARTAARLDHPNAVTVYDVVEEDDRPYLVMELVEARTLSDLVQSDGPLSPQRTAEVGLAVLGALEAAHAQGIVHRDVKPGNVLVRHDGRVVLTDFGIATSTGDASITHAGLLLGSPAYIAPERARGEAPGPASDLWSLGATLFTTVEGRPPYDGQDALLTVTAVVTGEHAPFVAAGPLTPVLEGLLEKDPQLRMTADQARDSLQVVADSAATTPLPARPAPAAEQRAESTQALPLGQVHDVAAAAALQDPSPMAAPAPAFPTPRRRSGRSAALLTALAVGVVGVVGYGVTTEGGFGFGNPPTGADGGRAGADGDGPAAVPAGWRTYAGPAASTVAVPPAYRRGTFNGEPQYKDPATGRTLRVGTVAKGKDDAVQDRRDQAASFARTHDDYRELRITDIDYRDTEAADWEFTYRDGGAGLHALSRVFVTTDGRGWSLFFQTRSGDDWAAARVDFDRIAAAFSTG